jgi:hypothetical protein
LSIYRLSVDGASFDRAALVGASLGRASVNRGSFDDTPIQHVDDA